MKKTDFPLSFLFLAALLAVGSGFFLSGLGCSNNNASSPAGIPTATPVCASPSAQGVTVQEPYVGLFTGDNLQAQSVTFATAETAVGISMEVGSSPATQGRFAIYTDSGSNAPAKLVIQTDPVYLTANAWNHFALPAPVYLPAAIYWIVDNFPLNSSMWLNTTGGDYVSVSYTWSEMPISFPTSGTTTATYAFSQYISTCP